MVEEIVCGVGASSTGHGYWSSMRKTVRRTPAPPARPKGIESADDNDADDATSASTSSLVGKCDDGHNGDIELPQPPPVAVSTSASSWKETEVEEQSGL